MNRPVTVVAHLTIHHDPAANLPTFSTEQYRYGINVIRPDGCTSGTAGMPPRGTIDEAVDETAKMMREALRGYLSYEFNQLETARKNRDKFDLIDGLERLVEASDGLSKEPDDSYSRATGLLMDALKALGVGNGDPTKR